MQASTLFSSVPQATQTASSAPATRTVRGSYVLLRADTLRLLVPQTEIKNTDYLQTRPVSIEGEQGLLHIPGSTDGAVYVAVSAGMRLLNECPADRFVSTSMQNGLDVHWCWSDVRILVDADLRVEALPPVMLAPYTPVREMAFIDGNEWAYMCSAEMLQQFALSQKG